MAATKRTRKRREAPIGKELTSIKKRRASEPSISDAVFNRLKTRTTQLFEQLNNSPESSPKPTTSKKQRKNHVSKIWRFGAVVFLTVVVGRVGYIHYFKNAVQPSNSNTPFNSALSSTSLPRNNTDSVVSPSANLPPEVVIDMPGKGPVTVVP
jgi:hypothetical protein